MGRSVFKSVFKILIIAVWVLLGMSSAPTIAGGNGATPRDYLMVAKEFMVDRLGISDAVKFSNIRMGSDSRGSEMMVCGWITVETIPGEATASAPFISFIDTASMRAVSASIDDGTGVVRSMCR